MTVYDIIILEWDLSEWTWDTQDNQANEHFIVWNSLQDYGVNGCAYTDFILCSRASNGPLVAELFAPVLLMANELASPFLHSIWSGPWLAQGLHKPLFTQTIMHTHANVCSSFVEKTPGWLATGKDHAKWKIRGTEIDSTAGDDTLILNSHV